MTKLAHAFKNYARTYNVEILNSFNPELQLWIYSENTESSIINKLKCLLTDLKEFKSVTKSDDKTKYSTFYSSSKAETVINEK